MKNKVNISVTYWEQGNLYNLDAAINGIEKDELFPALKGLIEKKMEISEIRVMFTYSPNQGEEK